jgi:hypothetical protein
MAAASEIIAAAAIVRKMVREIVMRPHLGTTR